MAFSKERRVLELDERLDAAAEAPELFEQLAEALVEELDAAHADVELVDPASWRRAYRNNPDAAPRTGGFLNQLRADIDSIEPMDRVAEARLARRIELLRMRLERARERAGLFEDAPELDVGLTPAEALDRIAAGRAGELPTGVARRALELHAARLEMVERNLYLVLINVERYAHTSGSKVDMIQEGCMALFRAVDGFDWRRGLLFRTYAVHWLNQAFRNHLYNFGQTVRVPVYLQKALKHISRAQTRIGDPNALPDEIAQEAELPEKLVESAISAVRRSVSLDAELGGDGEAPARRPARGRGRRRLLRHEPRVGHARGRGSAARWRSSVSARPTCSTAASASTASPSGRCRSSRASSASASSGCARSRCGALDKLKTPTLERELAPWLN